jgi:hypothetical protein
VQTLLAFLSGLDEMGMSTSYVLGHHRDDAITAHITASPDERWEVEFFADGTVEIERFRCTAERVTAATVEELLAELRAIR